MTKNATDPRWLDEDGTPLDEEDRGLVYDVGTLVSRRAALGLFGGVATATLLAACTPQSAATSGAATSAPTSTPTPSASAPTSTSGPLTETPDETAGPYPGDGSNGVNVLDDSGIVRSDIRSSFGSSTTTVSGVPLTIRLTVRDAATGSAVVGAAVYLWHCDAAGNYSLYGSGLTNENFLRGVQETDETGTVEFVSIFPGCYSGRWPHAHFEVYDSVATAISNGPIVKTSQLALPAEQCSAVYAQSDYPASARNFSGMSLATDNVFGNDGGIHQIATMSGSVDSGLTAAITVGV